MDFLVKYVHPIKRLFNVIRRTKSSSNHPRFFNLVMFVKDPFVNDYAVFHFILSLVDNFAYGKER